MAIFPNIISLLFLLVVGCRGSQTREPWTSLISKEAFGQLPKCAQECLLNCRNAVRSEASGSICESFGCVCAENSPTSPNYITAVYNASDCVAKSCPGSNPSLQSRVQLAFRDICQEAISEKQNGTASSSSATALPTSAGDDGPIMWIKPDRIYDQLAPCAKFALNSCRDTKGVVNEANCYPINKPEGWERYRGLANNVSCHTDDCICLDVGFQLSWDALVVASSYYCNYEPITQSSTPSDYDLVMGALATFCKQRGYEPTAYISRITGDKNTTGDLASPPPQGKFIPQYHRPMDAFDIHLSFSNKQIWIAPSFADKLAMGLGIPSLVFTTLGTMASVCMAWYARRRR